MSVKVGMQTYGWFSYGSNFKTRFGLETVLYEVKAAGYEFVDLSGYTIADTGGVNETRKLLKKHGLKIVSMSCPVGDTERKYLERTKEQMKFLKELGAKATMVSGWKQEKDETYQSAFRRLCDQCEEVYEFGKEVGLLPGYHNHMWTGIETEEQIINFLESTRIGFCPDVGHMAGAKADPLKLIKKYFKRITCGHLKDVIIDRKGNFSRFCEIGKGNAGVGICELDPAYGLAEFHFKSIPGGCKVYRIQT